MSPAQRCPHLLSFKFKRVYSELNSFVGKEKASGSEVEPPHLVQSLNYDYTSFQRLENRWHTFCCALCPQQLRESRAVQEMADPEHPLLSGEKQAPCNLVESGTKPHWDIPNTRCLCKAFWIFTFLFTFFLRKIIPIPPPQTHTSSHSTVRKPVCMKRRAFTHYIGQIVDHLSPFKLKRLHDVLSKYYYLLKSRQQGSSCRSEDHCTILFSFQSVHIDI